MPTEIKICVTEILRQELEHQETGTLTDLMKDGVPDEHDINDLGLYREDQLPFAKFGIAINKAKKVGPNDWDIIIPSDNSEEFNYAYSSIDCILDKMAGWVDDGEIRLRPTLAHIKRVMEKMKVDYAIKVENENTLVVSENNCSGFYSK